MEAKEMFEDGGGRNYANSHFCNQNKPDAAISRVLAVQSSMRVRGCTDVDHIGSTFGGTIDIDICSAFAGLFNRR